MTLKEYTEDDFIMSMSRLIDQLAMMINEIKRSNASQENTFATISRIEDKLGIIHAMLFKKFKDEEAIK